MAKQVLGSKNLEEFITKVATIPLRTEPGTAWHYSIAVDITGLIVERISGQPFDVYLAEHIFKPLGMADPFFSVPEDKWDRFLPNHSWNHQENKLFQHPAERMGFKDITFFSGGGGLVSTAQDLLTFAQAMATGGEWNGKRILPSETFDLMRKNHLPTALNASVSGETPGRRNPDRFGFGLGFGVDPTTGV